MQRQSVAVRDAATEYRKLVVALAAKAGRMGSTDAEGAAQEALRRSLADPRSRDAVAFYFHADPPPAGAAPEWSLHQLFAWLYGVLRFVVREERTRASSRRELLSPDGHAIDVRDPKPDQLDSLIDDELRGIVRDCLSSLNEDHRRVLLLRVQGLKYEQIAERLGVNANTVATWVRRGTQAVTRLVQQRTRVDRTVLGSSGCRE